LIAKISATEEKNQKSAKMTTVEKIGVNFFEQYRAWGLYVYTDASARTPKRTLHRAFLYVLGFLPYFLAFVTALTLNKLSGIDSTSRAGVCIYVGFCSTKGSLIGLGDNSLLLYRVVYYYSPLTSL